MSRRSALKLIAAAGASAGAACTDTKALAKNDVQPVDPVKGVSPLGEPWKTPDPFLFCVHHDDRYPKGNEQMGPVASLEGRVIGQDFDGKDGWRMYHGRVVPGFPQHPHRGFETVTVVRRGLLDHSDSLGGAARYGRGDVQWLTAGRGILHSEMFPLLDRDGPNHIELFQIWLNLPRADKLVEPHFSMLWSPTIPTHVARDEAGRTTEVMIVAGRIGDLEAPSPPPSSWASHPEAEVAIWTVKMQPGARWTLPAASAGVQRMLYFFQGTKLSIGPRDIPPSHSVDLRGEVPAEMVNGPTETEFLLLQGRPIGEPVVQYGPFVMTSREEIVQTVREYQQTQFGGWPWDRDDVVHAREEGRFAKHPGGRHERPA